MTSAAPDESILTTLQEVLDAWTEEDYTTTAEKCLSLLKKKRALDATVTTCVQRLLLQSYLQQQDYAKVTDWVKTHDVHKDLQLYASYRQESYDAVSKQATSKDASLLEQHLLAQSHFNLQQANPALKIYQDLYKDKTDDDEETQMELLTNALAVLTASNSVVPYVGVTLDLGIVDQAAAFLEEHVDSPYSDLAMNLGVLQTLGIDPSNGQEWLDRAEATAADEDVAPVQINQAWKHHFWHDGEDLAYNANEGTAAQKAVAKINQSLLDNSGTLASQPNPKWNVLQTRMYWYNRSVQQFQSKKLVECQESCQSLKKMIGGGKKKGKKTDSSPSDWWWSSRVDVILAKVLEEQSKASEGIGKLKQRLEGLQSQPSCPIIDHATAYVQLHLHALEHSNPSKDQIRSLLQSLPKSIQSSRAVVATLGALGSSSVTQKKKATGTPIDEADTLFGQGQYEQAASLYGQHLPDPASCSAEQIVYQLRRVQALAMSNQGDESTKLWEALQPHLDGGSVEPTSTMDGDSLEQQALPRSSTTSSLANTSSAASQKKKKRSQASVLKARAHKREAYLKELEARGGYNPDRPSKPNPERWVPKHERSRARRRGQNNRSAQGGGSAADAQKLDAAARRAGKIPASTGPSTANLKVSSGSRKGGRRR